MTAYAVPYITTPSGVRIGSAWTPPPARMDRDAQTLQKALLDSRTAQPIRFSAIALLWRLA